MDLTLIGVLIQASCANHLADYYQDWNGTFACVLHLTWRGRSPSWSPRDAVGSRASASVSMAALSVTFHLHFFKVIGVLLLLTGQRVLNLMAAPPRSNKDWLPPPGRTAGFRATKGTLPKLPGSAPVAAPAQTSSRHLSRAHCSQGTVGEV